MDKDIPKGKFIIISLIASFLLGSLFANISLPFWISYPKYKSFATPMVLISFPVFYTFTYYALKITYKQKKA
jgi:hypothetical protein